jgi:hypothetical protein
VTSAEHPWQLELKAQDDLHALEVTYDGLDAEPDLDAINTARDAVQEAFCKFFDLTGSLCIRHTKLKLVSSGKRSDKLARVVSP